MEPVRSLREVLGELTGAGPGVDPRRALREAGHGDLPDELLSEAVASYADTSPLEVAEHLAPFVTAYRQVGEATGAPDPAAALDLLTHAPAPGQPDPPAPASSLLEAEIEVDTGPTGEGGDGPGLEFGLGDRTSTLEPDGPAPVAEADWPTSDDGPSAAAAEDPVGPTDAGPDLGFLAFPGDVDDLWADRSPDGPTGEDDAGLDPTA